MKYRAWLHAIPEVKGSKQQPPPRWKQYRNAKGVMPTMPVLIYGRHLMGYLMEFGPTKDGQPVSFQEIESWSRMTRRRLSGWEASTLRQMSHAHAVQEHLSKDPNCPSPLDPVKDDKKEMSNKAIASYRQLNQSRRRKRGRRG